MRVYLGTKSVEVGIDMICSWIIYKDLSMMKNLRSVSSWVVSLRGNRIRCTQQAHWIIPLVDDNILLAVVVVSGTILSTDAGNMLISVQHMSQGYSIRITVREFLQAIVHHNFWILKYGRNIPFKITDPITNTSSKFSFITTYEQLQAL